MVKLVYNPLSNSFDYVSTSGDFIGDFYPSSLGKGVSGALFTHVNDGTMHGGGITLESILDDFYPSTLGKQVSGAVLPLATWYTNSGMKLSESGAKYTDSYTWYNTSSNQFANWIASGEKLSRWYKESSQKLGELASSGSNWWDSWKWYNTSSNQYSNWLASGEKLSRWYKESSQKLGELASSGSNWWDNWKWYNTSSSLFSNWLTSGEKLSRWFYESSQTLGSGSKYSQAYASAQIAMISSAAEINMLSDVDTQSTSPSRDLCLKWNGSAWVPAAYNATFEFTITSFSDGESTTQLIGTGTWKAQSAMTYTIAYNNGPPAAATVQLSNNGGAYSKVGVLTTPFTTGTNTEAAISYPSSRDQYLRFRASANTTSDYGVSSETSIYFRNYIYYGTTSEASGWDSSDITDLKTSGPTTTYTSSYTITGSTDHYVLFAHPASYTALHVSGMLFNSIICPFEAATTVSVTNSAGYTENYSVYRSTLTNLGSATLATSTSNTKINKIYYGVTTDSSSYTESDVESLANSTVSNTKGRTFTVAPTTGEYILYCLPVRLGTVTFTVGGFSGGFESPETVSITNANGQVENYYVYRSTNSGLGSTEVVVT